MTELFTEDGMNARMALALPGRACLFHWHHSPASPSRRNPTTKPSFIRIPLAGSTPMG